MAYSLGVHIPICDVTCVNNEGMAIRIQDASVVKRAIFVDRRSICDDDLLSSAVRVNQHRRTKHKAKMIFSANRNQQTVAKCRNVSGHK